MKKVMNNEGEGNPIMVSKLAEKPELLGDICGMLGDECKDLTVQLLNGEIDDTAFMSQAIDVYGQDKVNRAVFSSVMADKKRRSSRQPQASNSNRSGFPNGPNSQDVSRESSFPASTSSSPPPSSAESQSQSQEPSEQERECPICLAPAVFGVGKTVCEVLADARRNSVDPAEWSEEKEEGDYMACGNIVNAFADGKISNRKMVSSLIEKYGEDAVMDALKGVNRVLEDGALLAKKKSPAFSSKEKDSQTGGAF